MQLENTQQRVPDGKASPSHVIYLKNPLGPPGTLKVETVDPEKHQIHWVLSGLDVTNDQTTGTLFEQIHHLAQVSFRSSGYAAAKSDR
jgi:hypothetical protein